MISPDGGIDGDWHYGEKIPSTRAPKAKHRSADCEDIKAKLSNVSVDGAKEEGSRNQHNTYKIPPKPTALFARVVRGRDGASASSPFPSFP
ncbi:hypothetical protein E2P81_ATG09083 [Venturia nashicola]|uniref:Uncharacterized protein n=1 Tax=Venturia nashicola TaxID=86259 RepID=A0A4Z1NTZ6_9PEZI|nr:hypothetical protein E6O75_ATG09284 [Venturia nashicola]TLD20013.1 hypothetical protein E2P81_ATG09083 [Venturia nashicola]